MYDCFLQLLTSQVVGPMSTRKFLSSASCALLLMGCAVDAGFRADGQASVASPSSGSQESGPIVFSDLAVFDRRLAQSLADAKGTVVVTSEDLIPMRQLPPRLEKWLAAVDESGGKIETQSIDQSESKTRSLGLVIALIGAIRQARELLKPEQYVEARNFDAKVFYRRDATGDRVMERVEWVRRQP